MQVATQNLVSEKRVSITAAILIVLEGAMSYNLTGIDIDLFLAANTAAQLTMFVVVVVPTLALCLLCVVAVLIADSLNWPIRIALVNVYAGEICYWFGLAVMFLGYPARAYSPSPVSCRLAISSFIAATFLKFPAVSLYAVMVYVFLKYGVSKLKLKLIIPVVVVSWVCALVVSIVPHFPAFGLVSADGFCITESSSPPPLFIMIVAIIVVVLSVCMCITATFSVLTYRYFKKNTLEDNVAVKTAIAKNLAYLLIASVLYFIFYFLPASFNTLKMLLSNSGVAGVVLVEYVLRVVLNLASVATPIMTIVILKPVRLAMKQIFKKMFCRS